MTDSRMIPRIAVERAARRRDGAPRRAALVAALAGTLVLSSCAHRGGPAVGQPETASAAVAARPAAGEPRALGGADCARTHGYDVVVVGAGLAGLTAARELAHLDRSVLVLEATDRIGGRGFVGGIRVGPDEPPVPIDYGGAWIHGVPTNPLTALVDAMGFRRVRSDLDAPFYVDGRRAGPEEIDRFSEAWEAYEEALSEAAARIVHEKEVAERICAGGEAVAEDELEAAELCDRITLDLPAGATGTALCESARQVERDGLFVALPGERVDGADFVPQAAKRGAAGAIVPADRAFEAPGLERRHRREIADAIAQISRYRR